MSTHFDGFLLTVTVADLFIALFFAVIVGSMCIFILWKFINLRRRVDRLEDLVSMPSKDAAIVPFEQNHRHNVALWRRHLERLEATGQGDSPRAAAFRNRIKAA